MKNNLDHSNIFNSINIDNSNGKKKRIVKPIIITVCVVAILSFLHICERLFGISQYIDFEEKSVEDVMSMLFENILYEFFRYFIFLLMLVGAFLILFVLYKKIKNLGKSSTALNSNDNSKKNSFSNLMYTLSYIILIVGIVGSLILGLAIPETSIKSGVFGYSTTEEYNVQLAVSGILGSIASAIIFRSISEILNLLQNIYNELKSFKSVSFQQDIKDDFTVSKVEQP